MTLSSCAVAVFFSPGVFDGAEARRQRHTGHNAEGEEGMPPQLETSLQSDAHHSLLLLCFVSFFLFRFFRSAVNQLHKQADMQEEKNRIERVLGAISAPDLIQKVLSFALSVPGAHLKFPPSTRWHRCDASKTGELSLTFPPTPVCLPQEEVRPQDTVSVIGGVAGSSKQGRKAAWKFVKDNWEELYNRYQGGFLISRLIKVGTPGMAACVYTQALSFHRLCLCPPPPKLDRSSSALFVQKLTGQKCEK